MGLFLRERIGIDFGTSNTLIYIENKGIALREPTILAVNRTTQEVVAYGKEAEQLLGRTSDNIQLIHPIQYGVVAHYKYAQQLLAYFIKKAVHITFVKPEVVLAIPTDASKIERKATSDILREMGIGRAMLVEAPYIAAIGANLAIREPYGRLIVTIGGGVLDLAVVSYGEIVDSVTLRQGGNQIDRLIMDYVRQHYHVSIGKHTAERIKITIGNALYTAHDTSDQLTVQGRSVANGVPVEKTVHAKVIAQAIDEFIYQIVQAIKMLLSRTQPEMAGDIMQGGIILSGGGALLKRLPERLHQEIGIPVHLVNNPLESVAVGTGKLFNELRFRSHLAEKNSR